MFQKLTTRLAPMAVAALLVALPAAGLAQSTDKGKKPADMQGESSEMMDCQQVSKMQEKMLDEQQQMQTDLDETVVRMNAASGNAQQKAMAELLTKLVENRGAMQDMMAKMQPMMMQHMMQHVASGKTGGMSDCPMMKAMHHDGDRAESKGGHSEHR